MQQHQDQLVQDCTQNSANHSSKSINGHHQEKSHQSGKQATSAAKDGNPDKKEDVVSKFHQDSQMPKSGRQIEASHAGLGQLSVNQTASQQVEIPADQLDKRLNPEVSVSQKDHVVQKSNDALIVSDDIEKVPDSEKRPFEKASLMSDSKKKNKLNSLSDRDEYDDGQANSQASEQQQVNTVVMQQSERSLRRTTRVKTAKNNSEFIYYGKYNKELPRPRSFSKNNLQLAAGESSDSSNGEKLAAATSKSATAKKNPTGSASVQKAKKPVDKLQMRTQGPADNEVTDNKDSSPKSANLDHSQPLTASRIGKSTSKFEQQDKALVGDNKCTMNDVQDDKASNDWQEQAVSQLEQQRSERLKDANENNASMQDKGNKQTQKASAIADKTSNETVNQDQDGDIIMKDLSKHSEVDSKLNNDEWNECNSEQKCMGVNEANDDRVTQIDHKLDIPTNDEIQMQNPSGIADKTGQNTASSNPPAKDPKQSNGPSTSPAAGTTGVTADSGSKKDTSQTAQPSTTGAGHISGSRTTTGNGTASKKDLKKQQQAEDPKTEAPIQGSQSQTSLKTAAQPATAATGSDPAVQQQLYCICRTPDETNMICCDRCEEWYHFQCVGIKPEQIAEYDTKPFYCSYSKMCMDLQKKSKPTKAQEKAAEEKRLKAEKKAQKLAEKEQKAIEKASKTAKRSGAPNTGSSQTPQQQSANGEKKKVPDSKQPASTNSATGGVDAAMVAQKIQASGRIDGKSSKEDSKSQNQTPSQAAQQVLSRIKKEKVKLEKSTIDVVGGQNPQSSINQKWVNDSQKGSSTYQKNGISSTNQQAGNITSGHPQRSLRGQATAAPVEQQNEFGGAESNAKANLENNQKSAQNVNTSGQDNQKQGLTDKSGTQSNNIGKDAAANKRTIGNRRRDKLAAKQIEMSVAASSKQKDTQQNIGSHSRNLDRIKDTLSGHQNHIQDRNIKNAVNESFERPKNGVKGEQKEQKGRKNKTSAADLVNQKSRKELINEQAQESQSNRSHRRDKKNRSYVQPGQKPMRHFNVPGMVPSYGYPPMIPMFGMGTPNFMMAGGIHNLIGNIKSLNIQMAAAIVQAEKMKKLNEYNNYISSQNGQVGSKRRAPSQDSNSSRNKKSRSKLQQNVYDNVSQDNDQYPTEAADRTESQAYKRQRLQRQSDRRDREEPPIMTPDDELCQQVKAIRQTKEDEEGSMEDSDVLKPHLSRGNGRRQEVARPHDNEEHQQKLIQELDAQIYEMDVNAVQQSNSNMANRRNLQEINSQEGKLSNASMSKSEHSQVMKNGSMRPKNLKYGQDTQKKVTLDVASASLPTGRRLAEEVPMTGIVSRVYEDENHYHMVFKNCSSTKGNTTDDEERRAVGGEFKLEKRDLYKERKEQEAQRRAARLAAEAQEKNGDGFESNLGSNEQQVHDFLQDMVEADGEEFQNLAIALDLDEKEMEEEARIRLAQEGHLNLTTDQDEESIRLMKQALLLEKILENCEQHQQNEYNLQLKMAQQPLMGAAVAAGAHETNSPSNVI